MAFLTFPSKALLVAATLTACANPSGPSGPGVAAIMVGEWTHAGRANPLREGAAINAGFFVTIGVDSARNMQFWGRVLTWFVGDTGMPADQFGEVTGMVDSSYRFDLRIAQRSAESPGSVRLVGEVRGDSMTVQASWTGSEPGPFEQGCRFHRLH